ncbi:MAG: proline--tRNA ligase [Erysipelotrichales bacterium]|nr:proline--tRNA ligase [Erysipelotrichales bacterium]
MKLKESYFYTLREDAKDEDSRSGNLLVRSGMIKKTSAGVYMLLPLGYKTINKIRNIVKEEMDNAGAQELLMPSLIASEVYESCGRIEAFGSSMFHLKDRANHEMVLGPTHEELFTIAAKSMVKSYKDLPFNLYQIADKFRDEARPRYGLIRVKEFIMKDAYSFDADEYSLDESYKKMYKAYNKVFDRCKLDYKIVRANTGAMGGSLSEEYQAVTDIGEDVLVLCDSCDYASNLEIAKHKIIEDQEQELELEMVSTPHQETIEDVAKFLGIDTTKTVKALLMNVKEELVIFFVRGDREFNESKACKLLGVNEITFANDELIATSNAVSGFTGPIALNAKVVIDEEILTMKNFVAGANKSGYHYKNVNVKDIKYDLVGDISNVIEGDICLHCQGALYFKKGIEIGNLFKLGTKYSEHLGLTYLDKDNKEQLVHMGCYGIGLGRILAACVEQNNDEHGMILPFAIAPYQVSIIVINTNDEVMMNYANKLHDDLIANGVEVILDDRDERPGVKFNDSDLIGIPIRITIGKALSNGEVELKLRGEETSQNIKTTEIIETVQKIIKENI